MASRRPTRSFSRRSGRKPRYIWEVAGVDRAAHGQNVAIGVDLLENLDPDVKRFCTVERIIGTWMAQTDTSDLSGAVQSGIFVTSLEAFNVGARPEFQLDLWPVLWMDTIYTLYGELASGENKTIQRPIDIKARRRIRAENTLVFQRENISPAAVTYSTGFNVRILLRVS